MRREGVSQAAGSLQRADYIHYRRGYFAVLNRNGFEADTCECYDVIRKERSRLFPDELYRQETPAPVK